MNLWLLIFILSFNVLVLDALTYHISPDAVGRNRTCYDGKQTILRPCYTLQGLSMDKSLLKKNVIQLLFLPGIHVLQNETLILSGVSEVNVTTSTQDQEVTIECYPNTILAFENVQYLNIASVNFTSCTVLLYSSVHVKIYHSVFSESKPS